VKDPKFDDSIPTIDTPPRPEDPRRAARLAKDAARKRIARAVANPTPVADFWLKNEREFALHDPDQWQALAIRDREVADTETELQAAMNAFDRGLPIRDFIDVNPDQVYEEIKADVRKHGQLSYQTIEATPGGSEGYQDFRSSKYDGSPESAYRCYGLRLCLDSDVLGDARDLLIVYALSTKGSNLNNTVVEDAIKHFGSFTHYSEQVHKLLFEKAKQTAKNAGLSSEQAIASRQGDPVEMTQQQLEAIRYRRWAEIAHGKGGIYEGLKGGN
jgi:hypothetical protein